MKSKSVYFGTVFIALGVIGLVNNFVFSIDFSYAKYSWQIVLILLGMTFFSIPNKLKITLIIISGLITGYFLYGIFYNTKFEFKSKKVVQVIDSSLSNKKINLNK